MKGKFFLKMLLIVSIVLPVFLITSTAHSEDATTFNHCSSLPCDLIATNGDVVTVDGYYNNKSDSVFLNTEIIASDGSLQAQVSLTVLRIDGKLKGSGRITRDPQNIFNLPPMVFPIDKTITDPSTADSFGIKTVDHAVALTIYLGLKDITENDNGIDNGSSCGNEETENGVDNGGDGKLCDQYKRGPLGPNFPLSSFFVIPWFDSDGAKECGVEHDICYSNATSKKEAEACDKELGKCLDNEVPFSEGYNSVSIFCISLFSTFKPPTDKCLCDWKKAIDEDLVKKLAVSGSHDIVQVAQHYCCDDEKCKVGEKCPVFIGTDATSNGWLRDGECIVNPNYATPYVVTNEEYCPGAGGKVVNPECGTQSTGLCPGITEICVECKCVDISLFNSIPD